MVRFEGSLHAQEFKENLPYKPRACGTCQPLIPRHVARAPSILATSINDGHIGKPFETLDGAQLGVLSGVRVLLEFEGGETMQLEHGDRLKVAPQEEQPAQWSLSPYVPPRTATEAAAALAAIPAQIAVEQETVRRQLAEGERLVVNAIDGTETVIHEATCNAIEYQVNRELAWGEVRADLSNALGSARWNPQAIDTAPARIPKLLNLAEVPA